MIDVRHPLNVCRASAGTGKTYTLAAYYVGLLLSGEDYRSILAITFTNKATAEMSERIIGYLYAISQGEERAFLSYARTFMLRHAHASDEQLAQRAHECFRAMLLDYDNMQVMTIDSFLQTLLSGLAGVLRMSAGLNTELDIDHVIRQAVDQFITTEMTPEARAIIEEYLRVSLDDEHRWDIRESLFIMAKELYNESVQMKQLEGRVLFTAESIRQRRERLLAAWETNPDYTALKDLLQRCNPENYNRFTKTAYDRLVRSVSDPSSVPARDRFRGVNEKSCNADEMAQASELAERAGRAYNTIQLTIRFSREMELMSALETIIQRNLQEANSALLAKTAGTLSKALQKGDADFILEKAGIRYHHILMDEFQDTSQLQWDVIHQLIEDVFASEGNTILIVGDIKQSIYRWRNGNWYTMASLGTDEAHYSRQINSAFPNLTKNYRSSEQVVNFNLSLFKHILRHYAHPHEQELVDSIYDEGFTPETLAHYYQADKKPGGYVRFTALPGGRKEDLAYEMFDRMEELLRKGVQPRDMMILVREKKEAALICDIKTTLDEALYPSLSHAPMVSADSFLLEASEAVRTVIAGLRVIIQDDPIAAYYIARKTGKAELIDQLKERISRKTPLYEAICELIRLLIADEHGQYTGTETAYVNNLLDRTRAYVSTYGSNMTDFLVYWDDTMHAKPIPASETNAIRILTVHASKGLQSQTLFVPFCMWPKENGRHPQKIWCEVAPELNEGNDFVPIQDGVEMENSAYRADFLREHTNMRIDNLNMLYVALTRAEDNLFISTAYSLTKNGNMGTCTHVGRYLIDFLEADEYEIGEPVIKPASPDRIQTELQAELWADSSQVRFIQSEEGAMYTDYGEEAYRRTAKMEEGVLCHEIFANIRKADELDDVLDRFESRGEIRDKGQREELRALISAAWEGNDMMRDWFTAPWQLKLEEAIYIDRREMRPDRVMINPETKEAVVLDYKFGHWEEQYKQQVRDYMEALRRMDYSPVHGFLWFAKEKKLIEVK